MPALPGCRLNWPLPEELTDIALEAKLFGAGGRKQGHRLRSEPDWAEVQRELKRKHVTRYMEARCRNPGSLLPNPRVG